MEKVDDGAGYLIAGRRLCMLAGVLVLTLGADGSHPIRDDRPAVCSENVVTPASPSSYVMQTVFELRQPGLVYTGSEYIFGDGESQTTDAGNPVVVHGYADGDYPVRARVHYRTPGGEGQADCAMAEARVPATSKP